ncbi:MAG: glycosyltransferase family 2 protein [Faecalibacterium sp.]
MKLSACIVVYNGYDEALKAAQTVLHCTRRYPVTLYLVDNASPDGSGKSWSRPWRTACWQQVRASRWWCTAAPRTAALAPATI